ncbi:10215_t:CDS:2, partial [Dentiscutata heterogama]
GKVWVDFWYKKKIEPEQYISYKKQVEKLANVVEVEFNYLDEMIKITDLTLLEPKYQERGYKWVNKVKWDMENPKSKDEMQAKEEIIVFEHVKDMNSSCDCFVGASYTRTRRV